MTREDFATLALGYMEELTAFASRLARNAADADDLVQATYERAFRSWPSLQEARACRAWLFRIARNLHVDRKRATRARPELRPVEPGDRVAAEPSITPETVERLQAREIETALLQLPPEQREAVLLCDVWGFDYGEIAEVTGAPLGTVRSRIARGRARLATLLGRGLRCLPRERSS